MFFSGLYNQIFPSKGHLCHCLKQKQVNEGVLGCDAHLWSLFSDFLQGTEVATAARTVQNNHSVPTVFTTILKGIQYKIVFTLVIFFLSYCYRMAQVRMHR